MCHIILASHFSDCGRFSFLMVRWVDILFWFLESYFFFSKKMGYRSRLKEGYLKHPELSTSQVQQIEQKNTADTFTVASHNLLMIRKITHTISIWSLENWRKETESDGINIYGYWRWDDGTFHPHLIIRKLEKIKGKPMASAAFIELSQEKKMLCCSQRLTLVKKFKKEKHIMVEEQGLSTDPSTRLFRQAIVIWDGQKMPILDHLRHYCPKRQATFEILAKSLSGKIPNFAKIWWFGEKLWKVPTSFILLGALKILKKKKKKKNWPTNQQIPLEGNTSFLFRPYWQYQKSMASWIIKLRKEAKSRSIIVCNKRKLLKVFSTAWYSHQQQQMTLMLIYYWWFAVKRRIYLFIYLFIFEVDVTEGVE